MVDISEEEWGRILGWYETVRDEGIDQPEDVKLAKKIRSGTKHTDPWERVS